MPRKPPSFVKRVSSLARLVTVLKTIHYKAQREQGFRFCAFCEALKFDQLPMVNRVSRFVMPSQGFSTPDDVREYLSSMGERYDDELQIEVPFYPTEQEVIRLGRIFFRSEREYIRIGDLAAKEYYQGMKEIAKRARRRA